MTYRIFWTMRIWGSNDANPVNLGGFSICSESEPVSPKNHESDGVDDIARWGECVVDDCHSSAQPADNVCGQHADPVSRPLNECSAAGCDKHAAHGSGTELCYTHYKGAAPLSWVFGVEIKPNINDGIVVELNRTDQVAVLYEDGEIRTHTRLNDKCGLEWCDNRLFGLIDAQPHPHALCEEHFSLYLALEAYNGGNPLDRRMVLPRAPPDDKSMWVEGRDVFDIDEVDEWPTPSPRKLFPDHPANHVRVLSPAIRANQLEVVIRGVSKERQESPHKRG